MSDRMAFAVLRFALALLWGHLQAFVGNKLTCANVSLGEKSCKWSCVTGARKLRSQRKLRAKLLDERGRIPT
ncbi:hypothetical protein [Desulfitobacterium sp. THU1]|uniref:hypothetical protein n=1 Tax=Desulfitobacterium sp. THU1 TaxID=3138072 RepID=UPI00311EFC49